MVGAAARVADPGADARVAEILAHLAVLDTSVATVAAVNGVAGTFLAQPATLSTVLWAEGSGFALTATLGADTLVRDLFPGMPPAADPIAQAFWSREPGGLDLGAATLGNGAQFLMVDPPAGASGAAVQAALPQGWMLPQNLVFPLQGPVLLLK